MERGVYVDSSALVKLIVEEPESRALGRWLSAWPQRLASAIARVEVMRAVLAATDEARSLAEAVLDKLNLIAVDDDVLFRAARVQPPGLRTIDAIHLASALSVEGVGAFVTYDLMLADAARGVGFEVYSPAAG